jgi:hypothetical protein
MYMVQDVVADTRGTATTGPKNILYCGTTDSIRKIDLNLMEVTTLISTTHYTTYMDGPGATAMIKQPFSLEMDIDQPEPMLYFTMYHTSSSYDQPSSIRALNLTSNEVTTNCNPPNTFPTALAFLF